MTLISPGPDTMTTGSITCVAVIGTGVIGASWASNFLAQGLSVRASDPAPDAEARLRATVRLQWTALERMGLAAGASPDRLTFHASPEEALAGADFIQENGPERLDLKRELFRRIDAAADPRAVISTSSSTIMPSEIQDACARHPERVVLGHPFNPPHMIPLVEVAGGRGTSPAAVETAIAFYRAIGKHPIHLKKEIRGHVANRLQAALWREAAHLVAEGVASVGDVDAAIAHGPGMRWALLGPFVNLHLAGGPGGLAGLIEKPLWQAVQAMWTDLDISSRSTPALEAQLVAGVGEAMRGLSMDAVARQRDELLLGLLALKAKAPDLP
jgi:3-hydroxyacyl-CoA dehydrogenase